MSERGSYWILGLILGILIASCGTSPSIPVTTATPSSQHVYTAATSLPLETRSPTETEIPVSETITPTPQPLLQLTYMVQEPSNRVGVYAVTLNCPYENPPCVGEPLLLFTFQSHNGPEFTRHYWSQDGAQLLYSINAVGWGQDIYRADATGSQIQALTEEREFGTEYYPSWFDSEQQILYQTCGIENEREYCALMKMGPEGNDPTRLIIDESMRWQFYPRPSRDGSVIVFSGEMAPDTRTQLFIVDSEGNQVTQITSGPGNKLEPALSPDSEQIVFVQYRSDWQGAGNLMIINVDGTDSRLIASEYLTDFSGPVWSPIGDWIAYNRMFSYDSWILFIAKPDGTGVVQITNSPNVPIGLPAWRFVH